MIVKLTNYPENIIGAVEEAACNCYGSTPTSDGKIMNACYNSGHTSVLEFANFTFHISNVSRALLAQLTRHRHMSFAVKSQRYCSEDDFGFFIPPSISKNPKAYKTYCDCLNAVQTAYNDIVDELATEGVSDKGAREDARYVLPNACYTELELCVNLRSLVNFMNLRLCSNAQYEIRQLAKEMRDRVVEKCPSVAHMLVPKCEIHAPYSFCTEKKSCGRQPKISVGYKKKT